MSAFLVCPICGNNAICAGPHDPHLAELAGPAVKCPLLKGAIYVYVKDDRGMGISGVKVHCAKETPDSDPEGFAFFDPLEADTYPCTVDPAKVNDRYYLFSKPTIQAPVTGGRITLVEFQLNRYATLHVGVRQSDKKDVLVKDAVIKVETVSGGQPPETPEQKSLATGLVPFAKLRRESYKVTVALPGGKASLEWVIDGESEIQANPSKDDPVYFEVLPAGVIDFELVDEKGSAIKAAAKLNLEHAGKPIGKDVEGNGTAHVDKLEPGTVKVLSVDIGNVYEFVDLKST